MTKSTLLTSEITIEQAKQLHEEGIALVVNNGTTVELTIDNLDIELE